MSKNYGGIQLEGSEGLGRCGTVKIVVGGMDWYYQSFFDDSNNYEAVRLYGADGSFLREFMNLDDMTAWLLDNSEKVRKKEKEERQSIFMRRFEQLKGDMSDADFSVRLGMSGGTVYQYLTGRRRPSVDALAQIADRCGVTIDWLVGRE